MSPTSIVAPVWTDITGRRYLDRGDPRGGELAEKWKRRRLEHFDSSAISEASVIDSEPEIEILVSVDDEPPKYVVKTDEILIFPMGHGRQSLPPCEGPKLEPFSDGDVRVKFLRRLGENAVHSNVFEVIIDKTHYALKLFKTSHSGYFPSKSEWPRGTYPQHSEMVYQFRPFYRECRAYGRINERRLSHRYWRGYGYVRLPAYLRNKLCDITGLPDHYWQVRPLEIDGRNKGSTTIPEELCWPIYGIVKEMAPFPGEAIDPKARNIRTMFGDLRQLHKAGVLNGDIADRNYMAGRMIDFSLSYTLPNLWFERPTSATYGTEDPFKLKAESEVRSLRYTIIDSGVKTTAVQGRSNGSVSSHTRRMRNLRRKYRILSPLYQLGVNEPQPVIPRGFSESLVSWTASSITASP